MTRALRVIGFSTLAVTLCVTGSQVEASLADLASLRMEVARLIQGSGGRNSEWGVLAVSLERGDTLLSVDPDRPLTPASNQKLITTAAALHYLGPEYRFPTFLLTDGRVEDGVLEGNLVLYGTGDPAISEQLLDSATAPWEDFARELRAIGIQAVEGDIIADESFFRGPSRSPTWRAGYLDDWYAAPVSALTFAENVVTLRINGTSVGSPARVEFEPSPVSLPVVNSTRSVPGGSRRSVFLVRENPDDVIELRGEIGSTAAEVARVITVPDPASVAAGALRSVLETRGIRVRGSVSLVRSADRSPLTRDEVFAPAIRGGSAPALRTLAVHYSPPLRELIEVLNKQSHNLYGELLFFTVGRVVSGDGSFRGGSEALSTFLEDAVGVSRSDFHIEDGSGLSAENRATPAAFVRLLRQVAAADYADAFWSSLPEAGNRRELRRMYQSPAAGNLRAKTGTIRRVSALSGIVRSTDGEPIVFSILSNGVPSTSRAKRIEDGIGIELASFARPASSVRVAD